MITRLVKNLKRYRCSNKNIDLIVKYNELLNDAETSITKLKLLINSKEYKELVSKYIDSDDGNVFNDLLGNFICSEDALADYFSDMICE